MEPRAPTPTYRSLRLVYIWLLFAITGCARDQLLTRRTMIDLPADGRMHTVTTISRRSGHPLETISIKSASPGLRFVQQTDRTLAVLVHSPVQPGDSHIHFTWRDHRYTIHVRYLPADADTHQDGLPDALHLHSPEDRTAFRSWFVALAEQEASLPDDKLPPEIDDCAALLRFAYRESLVQHDDRWLATQSEPERFAALVSVAQYHYPETPLGLNLFRVEPGTYTPADSAAFAQFADAHALLAFNTYLVSRNIRAALPGDLLFFRQLEQNSQYHSMIVTGPHADWVIYHTGPIGKQKGEIRRVAIEDLIHHPDARWRPIPGNTNFLGVYRWNLLHDGD
jgi:uncharacterized protein YfaT (DUF1175 family)